MNFTLDAVPVSSPLCAAKVRSRLCAAFPFKGAAWERFGERKALRDKARSQNLSHASLCVCVCVDVIKTQSYHICTVVIFPFPEKISSFFTCDEGIGDYMTLPARVRNSHKNCEARRSSTSKQPSTAEAYLLADVMSFRLKSFHTFPKQILNIFFRRAIAGVSQTLPNVLHENFMIKATISLHSRMTQQTLQRNPFSTVEMITEFNLLNEAHLIQL